MTAERAKVTSVTRRARRTPPVVGLSSLRAVAGMTIDEVIRRIETTHPDLKPTRGALSAIERGHRGVSDELLEALTAAYDLPSGALMTDYRPRSHRHADSPTGARGVQEVAA